jgi:hypothetical protein
VNVPSLPGGTNLTALVANFTTNGNFLAVGGVIQASGTTHNDFTSSQSYVVRAADGTIATYTVNITGELFYINSTVNGGVPGGGSREWGFDVFFNNYGLPGGCSITPNTLNTQPITTLWTEDRNLEQEQFPHYTVFELLADVPQNFFKAIITNGITVLSADALYISAANNGGYTHWEWNVDMFSAINSGSSSAQPISVVIT